MHGSARDLPFDAHADVHGAGLRLVLTDSEATRGGYPFGFRFEAASTLIDAQTLDVTLDDHQYRRCPVALLRRVHHFYFTLPHRQRGEERRSNCRAPERRFQQADGSIKGAAEPGEVRYTLRLKHAFTTASIASPARSGTTGTGLIGWASALG